jgi:hypothetical protein
VVTTIFGSGRRARPKTRGDVRRPETCPYSRATRGNIDVVLAVGGMAIERQAA